MPDGHRTIEVKVGWIGLVLLALSVPVIVGKNFGWTWAFVTVSIMGALASVGALVFTLRRGRRRDAEVRDLVARNAEHVRVAAEIETHQGAIRRFRVGDRRSHPTFELNDDPHEEPGIRFVPGKTEPKEAGITGWVKPKPKPEPRTAWERIISADSEESDEPG